MAARGIRLERLDPWSGGASAIARNGRSGRRRMRRVRFEAVIAVGAALLLGAHDRAFSADAFSARAGVALAQEAATAWAPDARLVYIENDEPLGADGRCDRWGYLFSSKSLGRSRGYSLESGEIEVAEDLPFEFDAPPLPAEWLDSESALSRAVAEQLTEEAPADGMSADSERPALRTMFLVRGVLSLDDPDAAAWGIVYASSNPDQRLVVVDARSGKVVRTWRG